MEPYQDGEVLAERLGVALVQAQALAAEILADRTDSGGVAWWTGIDERARLLITDHLVQCVECVEPNLAEAEFHRLELLEAMEAEEQLYGQPLEYGADGSLDLPRIPPRDAPGDEVPSKLVALHVVGCFRAMSSALDCLAGGIVGVVGLDQSLLKADFDRVLEPGKSGSSSVEDFRRQAVSNILAIVTGAGPEGWFRWTNQMRNLLLHRPRRMQFLSWVPKHEYAALVNPQGRPVRMAWSRRHLPVEPSLADSEAFTTADEWLPLDEDLRTTVAGVLQSVKATCEGTLDELLKIWKARRASRELLAQPSRHVPLARPVDRTNFRGIRSGGELTLA